MRSTFVRFGFLWFVFGVASTPGCKVFDEGLLDEDDDAMEPPPPEVTGQNLEVADLLACDAPSNGSLNEYRHLDTSELENNLPALPNCLGELQAPGNDAFFAVDMNAGEKWHFHVQVASPAIDPAIYVLDSCSDSRSCQDTYFGINACAEGENEHFSFLSPATSRYFVAIDSVLAGGEPIEVWAVHASCGNLNKEHSEFCDDGNDDPLDGCYQCRPVLLVDRAEIEPNDGPLDANLVRFPDAGFGRRKVVSTLGSRCDFDFFELELPPAARTRITLTDEVDCGRADLQLRALGDPNPFAVGDAEAGGACVPVDSEDLPAGPYVVRVASRREPGLDQPAIKYTLDIDVQPLEEAP